MKKIRSLLALVLALTFVATLPSCRSVTAAKSLLATAEAVNASMNIYGELFRRNPPVLTSDEISLVRDAHSSYQQAHNKAVELVENDLSKLAPAHVGLLAASVIATIAEIKERHPSP